MTKMLRNVAAWAMVLALALGPVIPEVLAQQDFNFGDPTGGGAPNTGAGGVAPGGAPFDETAYANAVRDRLATRDTLEQMYQTNLQRQAQINQDLANLQAMQPQPGQDPQSFSAQVSAQIAALKQQGSQVQSLLDRTRQKLSPIYQTLSGDQQNLGKISDPNTRQELGTLIGAGGAAVVPIWNRMTAAQAGGLLKYGVQNAELGVVRPLNNAATNIATNAGTRAANAQAALGNISSVKWVAEPDTASNTFVLRAHDAATDEVLTGVDPVKTSVPVKIQAASGDMVDNPNATAATNDLSQLYATKSQIANEITAAKLKASNAVNTTEQNFFNNRAKELEAKQQQLEGDIKQYQDTNPSVGAQFKGLAMDAAKWGAMSVGITLGANVVTQLAKNGWDPSKINWSQATAYLTDPHFWGGTAGSFVGSMAGTMIASALPGGIFVKTLLSIGGAAVGWQLGSGQGKNTDWVGLGVTTVGSTAGFLLGMAIGGPIGAFLGGIVGQLASQYIYDKVKGMVIKEVPSSSGAPTNQDNYPPGPPQTPFDPNNPYAQGGVPPYGGGQVGQVGPDGKPIPPVPDTGFNQGLPAGVADVTQQMNQAYLDYIAAQQAGNVALAQQKQMEYQALRQQLEQQRQQSAPGAFDYQNSK